MLIRVVEAVVLVFFIFYIAYLFLFTLAYAWFDSLCSFFWAIFMLFSFVIKCDTCTLENRFIYCIYKSVSLFIHILKIYELMPSTLQKACFVIAFGITSLYKFWYYKHGFNCS
jgi:hypothetical protein